LRLGSNAIFSIKELPQRVDAAMDKVGAVA
jgi:hypothetical protein